MCQEGKVLKEAGQVFRGERTNGRPLTGRRVSVPRRRRRGRGRCRKTVTRNRGEHTGSASSAARPSFSRGRALVSSSVEKSPPARKRPRVRNNQPLCRGVAAVLRRPPVASNLALQIHIINRITRASFAHQREKLCVR